MQSAEDDWRVSKPEEGSRRVWSYGKTTEAIYLGTTFLIPFEIQPFMLKTMGQVNLFSWRWRLNQMVSNVFAHSMKKTSCREWPVQGLVGMINPFISKRPLNAPRNIMHSILTTRHRPLPSTGPTTNEKSLSSRSLRWNNYPCSTLCSATLPKHGLKSRH